MRQEFSLKRTGRAIVFAQDDAMKISTLTSTALNTSCSNKWNLQDQTIEREPFVEEYKQE